MDHRSGTRVNLDLFAFYLKCLVFLLIRTSTDQSLHKNQHHLRMVVQGPLIYLWPTVYLLLISSLSIIIALSLLTFFKGVQSREVKY